MHYSLKFNEICCAAGGCKHIVLATMGNDNRHYEGALLEEINDRLKGIEEGQASLAHVPEQLNSIENRLRGVESDVKTIKTVLKDHSRQLDNLEIRVGRLEPAHA